MCCTDWRSVRSAHLYVADNCFANNQSRNQRPYFCTIGCAYCESEYVANAQGRHVSAVNGSEFEPECGADEPDGSADGFAYGGADEPDGIAVDGADAQGRHIRADDEPEREPEHEPDDRHADYREPDGESDAQPEHEPDDQSSYREGSDVGADDEPDGEPHGKPHEPHGGPDDVQLDDEHWSDGV